MPMRAAETLSRACGVLRRILPNGACLSGVSIAIVPLSPCGSAHCVIDFSTTMREVKPPGTNTDRSVLLFHPRSTRDIPKSGLTKASTNSHSPPSNSGSVRSARSHGRPTRNGAAAVTVEGAQLLESTTDPSLSPPSVFAAAGHGKRPQVGNRAAVPIGSEKTSDSDPAAVETDAEVQRNQSSTGETSDSPLEDSPATPAESAAQGSLEPAGEEQCMARQRVVEQRIADLEIQVHSADTLIRSAADNQQRMFKTFQGRVQAVKDHLDAVQKDVKELEEKLVSVGEHLATERFKQHAAFQRDLQTYIDSIGLNRAALRQAELSGKLDALHTMHDTLSHKINSLAGNLEDMEEKRRARLELATQKLQNVVEGRTSLAIAQLVTDAKTCAAGMQQLLNDAKLDQILLAQAAKEVEERLREQKFAAVDISYVEENMSFGGITHAFAALLQTRFPQNELVLIYFVTVRPPALASMAYASMFIVPSAENTRRLLSTVAVDPSVSEMVVKVESIMAEAWEMSPQRTHLQYLMPTPQEDIRVAGSVDYVYEFMKTMHKVIQELRASGEIYEGRPCVLVYTGMRRGVEAPADTPYTEFKKLQNLRYLVTMYTSPVQETARLWHIMRNEVQLLDIFAPLEPVEVDGCHLRVYGGVAPFPELPNSPFIKLWLKILQYLARADRTKVGAFAVIKTYVTNMSRIRSRMLRLVRSLPESELAVDIHSYQSTTRPPELRATGSKGPDGGVAYASSEYHKGLAEAVESIIDTLTQSVLPYPAGKGFTLRRHLFVHVCEINVSCGKPVST